MQYMAGSMVQQYHAAKLWQQVNRAAWALVVFFNFSITKNDIYCIFYQVNLTGGRLFKYDWRRNRLEEIGLKEIGILSIKKHPKNTASAQLWQIYQQQQLMS